MSACPHCERAKRLERDERLVRESLEEARHALRFELTLAERLDLIAEEHELADLLDRIERERFAHA